MGATITTMWYLTGAITGWGITLRWAAREISRIRERTGYWQSEATKARGEALRLARETATYAAGCKQGREEVISLVPLLIGSATHGPADIGDSQQLSGRYATDVSSQAPTSTQ